jgi:hypothetical protein
MRPPGAEVDLRARLCHRRGADVRSVAEELSPDGKPRTSMRFAFMRRPETDALVASLRRLKHGKVRTGGVETREVGDVP